MKKRIATASISAAVALSVALTGQAFAASSFKDIATSPQKAQIETLQGLGIVNGVSQSLFQPEENLTNAQGISLIVKTTQISLAAISFNKGPEAEGIFDHVKNNAWYADSFIIAHYNGLDIPADIDPNAPMTREQFTHYLVQALEKTGEYATVKMYVVISDEGDITTEYQGTIQRALLYKLTALDEKGEFHPQQILNRAESTAMLYNAHQFIKEHNEQLEEQSGDQSLEEQGVKPAQ
ncbi:S-layer homology domain-containing protein [Paenibacillus algorifonticola]|uniref:S-layer homology domain-containing protein n=1 Tax=Paenibacillus algorifonticola TaxID=684063 RepID=A0A1I2B8T7_9BACL|nr:S-layer homology domain-containing protein [Paenibacillus algorifonticola]SFE52565.1 S-layer homology domain-containing protein [Paenibacillus algorifonticola]